MRLRAFCALALLVGSLVGVWAAQVPSEKLPALSVPKMAAAPTIDGVINPDEWREATAISGVVEQDTNWLFPRPTTFYLGWDADHLYLACRTWTPPDTRPQVRGRAPGTGDVGDATMELHLQPLGKNVASGRADSSYKFMANALGVDGDGFRVSVGQAFKNWQHHFILKAGQTKDGSAPWGGSWVDIELSASTKDFELVGPNRVGDQWRIMLGFDQMPIWTQARIPANSGYFDPGGYPLCTLVENTPAVQVVMDDLPGPCDGTAAVKFRAYNPTTAPVTLNVQAQYLDGATNLLNKTAPLTVEPGKTAEFAINEKLPKTTDNGSIYYQVTQGDKELFRYFTFFKTGYPEWQMHYATPKEFLLSATANPVRGNFFVTGDTYFLPDPDQAKAMHYRVVKEGETAPLTEGTVEKKSYNIFSKFVQLPPLTEGTYNVEAYVDLADGTKTPTQKTSFTKIDEAKAFPDWWQKGLGDTVNTVIAPFTAVTRAKDTVSVWGRTYRLNSLGLPAAITSQQQAVLAAPARIVVKVRGKETRIPLTGAPTFTEEKPGRITFTGKAEGAGLRFTSQGTIEQDGLCTLELTYAPLAGKPVTLDGLRVEFPFDATQAESLVCIGPGGNFSARTTRTLPQTPGRLWDTLCPELGTLGSGMTVGSFYPEVWLGSECRGMLWWGDNDKGWVPDDAVPAHSVVRQGKEVILSNNLIGTHFTLDAPRTVTFGYNASPFRPLVKSWRADLGAWDGTFAGPHKQGVDEKGNKVDGWNWLCPPSKDPAEWGALWAKYKVIADKKYNELIATSPIAAHNGDYVHTSVPLVGYGWKSSDDKTTFYFAPEWGDSDCYTPSNIDYYLYLIKRNITEGGLKAIYWDIFFPTPHGTLQNGTAYALPDGRIQPGFAGFNTRRFLMRSYAVMAENHLTPGSQVAHATNAYLLVATPWVDALLDGEFHKITNDSKMADNTPIDWVDGYPIDRLRSLSVAENWGTAISWMDHIFQDGALGTRSRRGLVDWTRMFDSWQGPSQGYLAPGLAAWGMKDNAEFIPFWRNTFVTTGDKDVLVTMWRLPDRVLLSVFNYDRANEKSPTIKLDLTKLQLAQPGKTLTAAEVDAYQEATPTLDANGVLTIPALKPHSGRLIGIVMK